MPANVWAAEYHSKIRKKIASANDNGCSRTAADHQCGGPGRTRTCNQTVMSGMIDENKAENVDEFGDDW
jgi:hypothetical protein